jgi:uncharacterized protein
MKKLITILFTLLFSTSIIADFSKGANAYNSGDYKTAFKELLPHAKEGNSEAQWVLGIMYRWGYGILKDYSEAFKWFEKSGNQGNAKASAQLAEMYFWGSMHGLNNHKMFSDEYKRARKKNNKLAYQWMKKAAEQGNIIAMYRVGLIYARGAIVRQNKSKAKEWFNLAYSQAPADLKQNSRAVYTLLEDIERANDSMESGYFDEPSNIRLYLGDGMGWY